MRWISFWLSGATAAWVSVRSLNELMCRSEFLLVLWSCLLSVRLGRFPQPSLATSRRVGRISMAFRRAAGMNKAPHLASHLASHLALHLAPHLAAHLARSGSGAAAAGCVGPTQRLRLD